MSTDALVLIRVFDVGNVPESILFIEPWKQYIDGKLGFRCNGTLKGRPIAKGQSRFHRYISCVSMLEYAFEIGILPTFPSRSQYNG